jgi:hypothetical protein
MVTKLTTNKTGINDLKAQLLDRLVVAVASHGVPEAQSHTPIWSQRLHNSARAENPQIHSNSVTVDLVFGGVSLPGERKEIGIVKDVDYALTQEIEKGFLTNNLPAIGRKIAQGLNFRVG